MLNLYKSEEISLLDVLHVLVGFLSDFGLLEHLLDVELLQFADQSECGRQSLFL